MLKLCPQGAVAAKDQEGFVVLHGLDQHPETLVVNMAAERKHQAALAVPAAQLVTQRRGARVQRQRRVVEPIGNHMAPARRNVRGDLRGRIKVRLGGGNQCAGLVRDAALERAVKAQQALLAHDVAVPGDHPRDVGGQQHRGQVRQGVGEVQVKQVERVFTVQGQSP